MFPTSFFPEKIGLHLSKSRHLLLELAFVPFVFAFHIYLHDKSTRTRLGALDSP
jgi:hypothetical protein